jgi:hypothetical protein
MSSQRKAFTFCSLHVIARDVVKLRKPKAEQTIWQRPFYNKESSVSGTYLSSLKLLRISRGTGSRINGTARLYKDNYMQFHLWHWTDPRSSLQVNTTCQQEVVSPSMLSCYTGARNISRIRSGLTRIAFWHRTVKTDTPTAMFHSPLGPEIA